MLFALVAAAAGLHLGWLDREGKDQRSFSLMKKGVGVALIIGALVLWFAPFGEQPGVQWTPYTPERLAAATKAEKPVMLDFYADWCSPAARWKEGFYESGSPAAERPVRHPSGGFDKAAPSAGRTS